jgi:hypothetical protein
VKLKRQSSIDAAFMKAKFDVKKARRLFTKIFILDIVPNHLTDSAAVREFCCYLNPNFRAPARRTLTRDISRLGQETKVNGVGIFYLHLNFIVYNERLL